MSFLPKLNFSEYFYILPILIIFLNIWSFFIKSNFLNIALTPNHTDKISQSNVIKKAHYSIYIYIFVTESILLYISFFFYNGYSSDFLYQNFLASNFNLVIVQLVFALIAILLFFSKTLTTNTINYGIDFFFSISNLVLFLILILQSNNMFCFVFLLELCSITILYKFISSKFWYKTKNLIKKNHFEHLNRQLPKNYLNMLFFQYWSTFFSSILIFFAISNLFFMYGSVQFTLMEYLSCININNFIIEHEYVILVWLPFLVGFFIKIGLTPLHLFKIEVYKGIPLVSVLFYTTLYFYIYFMIFILLIAYQLDFLKALFNSLIAIIAGIGILYIMFLIFDVNSLKSFFAYSTVINSIMFFLSGHLL